MKFLLELSRLCHPYNRLVFDTICFYVHRLHHHIILSMPLHIIIYYCLCHYTSLHITVYTNTYKCHILLCRASPSSYTMVYASKHVTSCWGYKHINNDNKCKRAVILSLSLWRADIWLNSWCSCKMMYVSHGTFLLSFANG